MSKSFILCLFQIKLSYLVLLIKVSVNSIIYVKIPSYVKVIHILGLPYFEVFPCLRSCMTSIGTECEEDL